MEEGYKPVHLQDVALLAEGVDRNIVRRKADGRVVSVALLAEGVDRNCIRSAM